MPREARQEVGDIGTCDERVEFAVQMSRDSLGVLHFVVRAFVESHRNRDRPRRARLAHVGDYGRRVDAAGEKGAERDVADQAVADGIPKLRVELVQVLRFPPGIAVARELEVPIAPDADAAVLGDEQVRRGQFLNRPVDRVGRRNIEE